MCCGIPHLAANRRNAAKNPSEVKSLTTSRYTTLIDMHTNYAYVNLKTSSVAEFPLLDKKRQKSPPVLENGIISLILLCRRSGQGLGLVGRREPILVVNKSFTLFHFTCVHFIARYHTFRVDVLNEYRDCLAAHRIYTAFR